MAGDVLLVNFYCYVMHQRVSVRSQGHPTGETTVSTVANSWISRRSSASWAKCPRDSEYPHCLRMSFCEHTQIAKADIPQAG